MVAAIMAAYVVATTYVMDGINQTQSLMYNHFLEFSTDEMVDAYTYFDHIHDYEGCRLVGAAFAQNTSIDFQKF